MSSINTCPKFTDEQVRWLNTAFPENTTNPSNPNELFIRLGNRQVVQRIELAIAQAKAKIPK